MAEPQFSGEFQSPGGFVFGVVGWNWGEPRPRSITFFLDNTAKVCDQHGRPIRGTLVDNKEVRFADTAPQADQSGDVVPRPLFATHAQVVAALVAEHVDWTTLANAGWPQLSYEDLKKLPTLPPPPLDELRKIRDPQLRRDAMRARQDVDEARATPACEAESLA